MTDLQEAVKRARHDLGRYIAFQIRWLPEEPEPKDLLEALQSDLLHTRRGPSGSEDAWTVWARVREGLLSLGERDPQLQALESLMTTMETQKDALCSGEADAEALKNLFSMALEVADVLAALGARVEEEPWLKS
jgi:hypothetical protein